MNAPVLVYDTASEARHIFDWRQLLPLYNDTAFALGSEGQTTTVVFRGGLMVCADSNERFNTRVVHVELLGVHSSQRVRDSIHVVNNLVSKDVGCWRQAAKAYEGAFFDLFNRGAPAYTAALSNQHAGFITERSARNFGQLMSMVDCLCLLLSLQRVFIQGEVQDMVLVDIGRG